MHWIGSTHLALQAADALLALPESFPAGFAGVVSGRLEPLDLLDECVEREEVLLNRPLGRSKVAPQELVRRLPRSDRVAEVAGVREGRADDHWFSA